MSIPPFSASDFAVPETPLSLEEIRRLLPAEDDAHIRREPRFLIPGVTDLQRLRKLLEHDGNVVAGDE